MVHVYEYSPSKRKPRDCEMLLVVSIDPTGVKVSWITCTSSPLLYMTSMWQLCHSVTSVPARRSFYVLGANTCSSYMIETRYVCWRITPFGKCSDQAFSVIMCSFVFFTSNSTFRSHTYCVLTTCPVLLDLHGCLKWTCLNNYVKCLHINILAHKCMHVQYMRVY